MPGIYAADRSAASGRAGLALPFTPTTGPLRFAPGTNNFLDVPMHDHYAGPASNVTGLQTHGISECAVFCAAELTGRVWGGVYFAHVQGGDWSGTSAFGQRQRAFATRKALNSFASRVDLAKCHAIILVPGELGYREFAGVPQSLGFPAEKLSVYISNTSGGLGFAVEFRTMGEFGELDTPTVRARPSTPYGCRNSVGSFTDW
jgi:hypothetical protein